MNPTHTTTPTTPLLVDAREAARLLNLSESYVRHLTRTGRLPCVRLGRAIRYRPAALDATVANMEKLGLDNALAVCHNSGDEEGNAGHV